MVSCARDVEAIHTGARWVSIGGCSIMLVEEMVGMLA